MSNITLIEPTWNWHTHLPVNLGMLRLAVSAAPSSVINYVGGKEQIELMQSAPCNDLIAAVNFYCWQPMHDSDTLPNNVLRTYLRLQGLPKNLLKEADKILFCSCTPTVLSAITFMGLSSRSFAVLHGNANDLHGWRSRNPIRKWFDFKSAMKRFVDHAGTVIVLEERLQTKLGNQHPWLSSHINVIPHPLLAEEASLATSLKTLQQPIHIGFAGNASRDKGFIEFLELAKTLSHSRPDDFRFHAIGYLPEESRNLNLDNLATKAKPLALKRDDYLARLACMDFIFLWHHENYYSNAPSGVIYDAINLGVPIIARRYAQLSRWADKGVHIGFLCDDLNSAEAILLDIQSAKNRTIYFDFIKNISTLRASFYSDEYTKNFKSQLGIR